MVKMTNEQKELVKGIYDYLEMSGYNDLKSVIKKVIEVDIADDFYISDLWYNCGSRDLRIISKSDIDDIYYNSTVDLIKDCYDLSDKKIPSFIEIDWDKTVQNCKVDGFGHHFSGWDGSEYETENYYIFKN